MALLRGTLALSLPLLLLVLGATVAPRAAEAGPLHGRCTVSFSGSSTLHGFQGNAPCEPFTLEIIDDSPADPSAWKAQVRVAVSKMDTGNAGRDRKMAKMFGAQTHPWIEASFDSITPGPLDTLRFRLTIGESTHTVVTTISDRQEAADELSFTAAFSLSLAAYALKPPSVFGVIRVADEVAVRVAATVKRDDSSR